MRNLFATRLYEAELADAALLDELAHSIRTLAEDDEAGRRWSKEHRYPGYTSYASLNDLPQARPGVRRPRQAADAPRRRVRHGCEFDLHAQAAARQPVGQSVEKRWTSQWTHPSAQHHLGHVLRRGAGGSGAIRFEDPRLPLMMAAPTRTRRRLAVRHLDPRPGLLLMWESWLRHEVLPGAGKGERLSISFNFA